MSTYRAYLRTHDGVVSDKTVTHDPDVALEVFSALVNRTDLDGQRMAASLTRDNQSAAFHRFDKSPGNQNYWRDRLNQIEWPDGTPARGGGRPGAGRKPLAEDSDSVVVTLRLTPAQRDKLRELGGAAWVRSMLDA